MSAAQTRQRISDYHSFLELVCSLSKEGHLLSVELKPIMNSVSEFLRTATSRDIRERGKNIEDLLSLAARKHDNVLPRKKSIREISREFRALVETEPDIWKFGIRMEWLSDRFDVSRLPHTEDLPRHARVGIGVHADRVSVEEVSLLEDTFFLLVRARRSHEAMMQHASREMRRKNHCAHQVSYPALSALNSSVCTYSRLGVLTAFAFVEAFVNSIGWNEAAARSGLSAQERSELTGFHKGRYLNLESKLERIPRIIRADKASPIILSDEGQRREPFISFLKETKEVRDSSVHYAPGKAPILRPPQEWLRLVEAAVRHSVAVARDFWSACYPGRQQPKYLARLYYEGLLQQALDRLIAAESVMEQPEAEGCIQCTTPRQR